MKISYYYLVEDDTIHEYQVPVSEPFMISTLSAIGKGKVNPDVHDLLDTIKIFYFPSGRVWYRNGNRFVGEKPTKYRWARGNYRRSKAIEEADKKGK